MVEFPREKLREVREWWDDLTLDMKTILAGELGLGVAAITGLLQAPALIGWGAMIASWLYILKIDPRYEMIMRELFRKSKEKFKESF